MLSLMVTAVVYVSASPACIKRQAWTPSSPCSSTLVGPSPTLLKFLADGDVVSEQVPLPIYVIADLDTEDGPSTLQAALAFSVRRIIFPVYSSYLAICKEFHFCTITPDFLHNPALPISDPGRQTRVSSLFSHLPYKNILSKVSSFDLLRAVDFPIESRQEGQVLLGMPSLDEITGGITFADVDKGNYRRYLEASRVATEEVDLASGASGLTANGRVRLTVLLPSSNRDMTFIDRKTHRI